MSVNIALQLYTLRNELNQDFTGTLKKVSEIGYKGVEFAGYGGMKASDLKNLIDELGLQPAGSHVGIDQLVNNINEVIEYNLQIGNKYVICPWDKFESSEELYEKIKLYNKIGETCKDNGLQFCYHNHAHEFEKIDGKYILDIIFGEIDPELLKAEIDTYWVQYAGVDPVEYIKKYSGRCPLLHQKDMAADPERSYTEIGNGIMDIGTIYSECSKMGTEWFIVEQDECKGSAIESVKISFENLKKIIK